MAKRKNWLQRFIKREGKRVFEYMIAGGVWFWSGYLIISFLDDKQFFSDNLALDLFFVSFLGNAVGITLNFLLERYWVFKTKNPAKLLVATKRYIVYTIINAFGLNYLILQGLRNVGIEPEIGQFIASGFFTVWNYYWYKVYVFASIKPTRRRHLKHIRHHA